MALESIVAFGGEPDGPSVTYEYDPLTDHISQVALRGGESGVSIVVYLIGGGEMHARADAGQTEVLPVTGLTYAMISHAEASSPPSE